MASGKAKSHFISVSRLIFHSGRAYPKGSEAGHRGKRGVSDSFYGWPLRQVEGGSHLLLTVSIGKKHNRGPKSQDFFSD